MNRVILGLAAACASARLAPRQRAQMHVGRGLASMGMAAVALLAQGASAEPPRPPGEDIFHTKVVFEAGSGEDRNGPINYMTSDGAGGLVPRFVQHIADFFDLDWEDAVHKCRWDFGARMCAAMHCQQSFKTHHCIDWMGSDRLFSTSGDKFTDRTIILTGVDENIALGKLMPSWKHSTGKVMIETYKDMHLIGSDPSLPAPYSYGEFDTTIDALGRTIGSQVSTLGMFAAGLCLTDPNCIEAARKFAEEYDWGDIVIPSCEYGARVSALKSTIHDSVAMSDATVTVAPYAYPNSLVAVRVGTASTF